MVDFKKMLEKRKMAKSNKLTEEEQGIIDAEAKAIQEEGNIKTLKDLMDEGLVTKGKKPLTLVPNMPRNEAVSDSNEVLGVSAGVSLPLAFSNNTEPFRITKVTVSRTCKTADFENVVVSMEAEISSDSLLEVKKITDRLCISACDSAMAQKVRLLLALAKDDVTKAKYQDWLNRYDERTI